MVTAIILAGGLGARLQSEVPDVPKPMAPVSGRPFLEHLMDKWTEEGVDKFILSVGHKYEIIINHFGNSYNGISIDYAIEKQPMGTGGGVLMAMNFVDGDDPILILNGDTFFAVNLSELGDYFKTAESDWCFSLFRTEEKGRYMGLDVQGDGKITSLNIEDNNSSRLCNGGVYMVRPKAIKNLELTSNGPISLENDIFPTALKSGQRLFGKEFLADFIDIGIPEDYRRAQFMLGHIE